MIKLKKITLQKNGNSIIGHLTIPAEMLEDLRIRSPDDKIILKTSNDSLIIRKYKGE